jgi:hypothetical protein
MSYDELPPDLKRPRSAEEAASRSEQEPSSPDAPPAASTRRRRAQTAGTDAASAPSPPAPEQTARVPRRTRAKTTASNAEATENRAVSSTEAGPSTSPEERLAPPKGNASSRAARRRPTARTAAEAPPPKADASPENAAPSAGKAPPELPARKTGAGRKQATASGAPSESPATPAQPETQPQEQPARHSRRRKPPQPTVVEPIAARPQPETSAPAPPSPEPAPAEKPRRRSTRQSAAPPPSARAETRTGETAPAPGEETPREAGSPETEPPGKRRRSRTRRTSTAEPVITPQAAEARTADAALEATATPEATETAPAKSRRNRRGGRTRRSGAKAEPAESTTLEAAPESEPVVEPEEPVDRTQGAHLLSRNGMPEIHIDGSVFPPILFFGNVEGERNQQRVLSQVRRAARAGVHLYSTLIELPCPLSEATHALDEIDNRLRALLEADPAGYVMPRIVFIPARGWKREYPTDIATYTDGTTGDPSISSERFWQEAERSLTTLIAHLRSSEWGRRVFGYHLERGEWFQPADLGYDRSIANRDAFRDWLRERYQQSLVALRAAWYDGDVQFHTAEIPTLPTKPNLQRAFFETRRERRYIDFHEFTSESTAKRLIALSRAVKKAANHQALVSVCYGYTFEFGHPFSGHLALSALLSAPAIDLVCGPPSYRDRKPGGAASYPAPVDSLPLHGKLWLAEDDTKTYLAPVQQDPDDFNPRLSDRFQTEQAQTRALGQVLAHTTAVGFMDLWGEGWLDEDSVWDRLGRFTERYATFLRQREHPRVPEVVAMIDEKSLLHIQHGESFFRKLTNGMRDSLQRAGISYGNYLQSDLLAEDFPTDAKLYLFLTPYRLTTEQRAAIKEKLQRDGKTLAWLYAPGSCEERPTVSGVMEEAATGATGMVLRQQEWNSEVGSRIVEPHHVVTERLSGRDLGTRERLNPSFFVDDTEATTLAEYQGSGLPSLAVKNCGTWKSVFVGDPVLPLELLRGICRYAGVHVWTTQGEDVASIGNGWVTLHAGRDGQRALRLPEAAAVYDFTEGRLVADGTREYRFFLRAGMTHTFCVGGTERFVRMGLPNVSLSGDGRERNAIESPAEPRPESPPIAPPPTVPPPLPSVADSDRETLEAVLNMDLSQLEGIDFDALATDDLEYLHSPVSSSIPPPQAVDPEGEVSGVGRRRRRRGGRGRGRRKPGSETDERDADFPASDTGTTEPPLSLPGEEAAPSAWLPPISEEISSEREPPAPPEREE